jgi:hypothetical protein
MMVVPLHRIPKTWENLPNGHVFYEQPRVLIVDSKGNGSIVVYEAEDTYEESRLFSKDKPKGSHLKITKQENGVNVVAYDLGKGYIFYSHAGAMENGIIDGSEKMIPVLYYKEITSPKKKKQVVKKKAA